ncbi:MAG: hypothetical protein K0U98_07775 [Deltaproteobacteria bacterium]|nr:hypothetical protein [Deltaproteobacteria bacterium]
MCHTRLRSNPQSPETRRGRSDWPASQSLPWGNLAGKVPAAVLALTTLVALTISAPFTPTTSASELDSATPTVLPAHEVKTPAGEEEPIASIGHGAFFDHSGQQIVPTAEFVARAQSWYRERLLARLAPQQEAEFDTFEQRLTEGMSLDSQSRLVTNQRSLEWLATNSTLTAEDARMLGKLKALKNQLNWVLPRRDDLEELRELKAFKPDLMLESRLQRPEFNLTPQTSHLVTTNSGQDYIDECAMWSVPIPPSIGVLDPAGLTGWRSLGFIPTGDQFIVGTPAEVRVFESSDGMCIALPRYTNGGLGTVFLDGVICLSQITSKVCYWDNQMGGVGFNFAAGDEIPIGVPDFTVDPMLRYQGGGAEIEFGSGGICADCHAGENPYIIHPDSNLGSVLFGDMGSSPLNLPTFGPDRHDPIVGGSWPQNALSHAQPLVPAACSGCHSFGGSGGRFPHLSSDIPDYCNTILAQAITDTMPPGSPGSQAGTPAIVNFQAFCNTAPSSGPSNRGDPHLTTTNGVRYDFQAAGEFVSLRNSATGFELQTRQTPVLTTFTPGANAHTGLSSCVSLNTAAAFRLGERRISYQPLRGGEQMLLRIDGHPVTLNERGFDLGGGNWIANAAAGGGIEVTVSDGTRVIVTPNYWSSQGYWYLNVEVLDTPAREGTMGHILGSDWLPLAPNGSSFGPAPASIPARDFLLNQVFANAWRVTSSTSLFDYEPGTSTEDFTEKHWPPPSGTSCTEIPSNPWPGSEPRKPVKGMDLRRAKTLCSVIEDQAAYEECVFDLNLMGDPAIVNAYLLTLQLRNM